MTCVEEKVEGGWVRGGRETFKSLYSAFCPLRAGYAFYH